MTVWKSSYIFSVASIDYFLAFIIMRETLYLIDIYGFDIFIISHNNDYDILWCVDYRRPLRAAPLFKPHLSELERAWYCKPFYRLLSKFSSNGIVKPFATISPDLIKLRSGASIHTI